MSPVLGIWMLGGPVVISWLIVAVWDRLSPRKGGK